MRSTNQTRVINKFRLVSRATAIRTTQIASRVFIAVYCLGQFVHTAFKTRCLRNKFCFVVTRPSQGAVNWGAVSK